MINCAFNSRNAYLRMTVMFMLAFCLAAVPAAAQQQVKVNLFKELNRLEPLHATKEAVVYRGRRAVKVMELKDGGEPMVRLKDIEFRDGTIEAWVAGMPKDGAFKDARGYVGIAFRVSEDNAKFECFYLRPTNGRVEDQVRRNHALQYTSTPDYPWFRLRKESTEKYESYADLVTGEWTKIKIVVKGNTARLYVHDADQPNLIVNDLKLGADARGGIALWIGLDTEAYFSDLKITTLN